jgi:hypothetical protein
MVALKKGDITQTPVQTQFGWHVIKLEDVRPAKSRPWKKSSRRSPKPCNRRSCRLTRNNCAPRPRCNKRLALIVERTAARPPLHRSPSMPGQVSSPGMLLFSYDRTHNFCTGDQKVARKPGFPPKNR